MVFCENPVDQPLEVVRPPLRVVLVRGSRRLQYGRHASRRVPL